MKNYIIKNQITNKIIGESDYIEDATSIAIEYIKQHLNDMKRGKLSDINEISKIYIYKGNDGSGKQIYSQELQNFKASNNILTVSGENDNANIFFNNNDSEEKEENTNMDNMKDINYNAFNMDNNWDEISTTLVDDESKNNISIFNENYEDKISPDTTSELISDSLNHFAGDLGYDIYNMDIEELVSKIINDINNNYSLDYSFEPETNDMEEYSKWYDSIEAEVLKQLKNDQLKEDTNINIDKVEIDIDELDNEYNKVDDEASCCDYDDSFDYDRDEFKDELLKDEIAEAKLSDEEKFEREFEKLDIKASKYEQKSEKCFEKGDDEGGYYWQELADEVRREMDMMLATRPEPIDESLGDLNSKELKNFISSITEAATIKNKKLASKEDIINFIFECDEEGLNDKGEALIKLPKWLDKILINDSNSIEVEEFYLNKFLTQHVVDEIINNLNESLIADQKYPVKSPISENVDEAEEKWNIGSDKSNLTSEEIGKLKELAKMLQDNSPNNWKYTVEKTYEDFGAGMQWYTIICYDNKGNDWQVLDTKEWLDLMNTGDIEATYNEVVNGRYFQDKKQKGKIDLWKWDI